MAISNRPVVVVCVSSHLRRARGAMRSPALTKSFQWLLTVPTELPSPELLSESESPFTTVQKPALKQATNHRYRDTIGYPLVL